MLAALTVLLLVALLVPVAVIDVRRRLIPDRLTAPAAVAALALALASGDPTLAAERLVAGAAAGGLLLAAAVARPGAMGMGDVKLAAVLGLLLGRTVAVALLAAFLLGTIAGAALAARVGLSSARRATVPFGPILALGAAVALIAGEPLIAWYAGR